MTKTTFAGLGIGEQLAAALLDYGISEPSPVQAECIPAALEGRDVLAQSQTGTGKTLAYLLPLLQRVTPADKTLQGLILAPTQELAMQIQREAEKYGEPLGIQTQALIGGAAIKRQLEKLKLHPQLVVGTPGRIREILALRKLKLHTLRTVVVDEVDQMFQLGGTADVEHILRGTLRDRQLMFLSATINPEIRALAAKEMKEPLEVGIEPEQRTSKTLEHLYFVCEARDKIDMLRRIVRHFEPERTIAFINNTDQIAEVEGKMNFVGLSAGALYGDADKTARSLTLKRFREGKIRVLVASDVAARGLDIEELTLVVNLDPPIDAEHYVHRVGRTGRMGRKGLAVSIIAPQEEFIMRKFSRELGIAIESKALYGGKLAEAGAAVPGKRTRPPGSGKTGADETTRRASSPESTRRVAGEADGGRAGKPAQISGKPGSRAASDSGGPRKASPTAERKKERLQDRKNKGAPKWLKNKPPRS
ncbi:DEAD/DEAH box family ATP-dependent RNA helicase [Paenibacillus sp. J53TS2]|uniref:DEAD/DEAH box helicase n=1 Tax=Paenibacillus sp. J53TS2 TaxID=2807197 RepID=UPI000F957E45|nr:DEAD/DEAH box helicase [Paenibacillus sp. J53TS2]GIP49439.1 DEAD/DEAH box family ATP-dependent RNA helicase [Paenibacillus sp. J53TS2]